jgi:ferric-dicitrate binding protein FerR (iron transport regulator)
MSREERRAYQRQMKAYEKGPALPPAARARAERNAARREARRAAKEPSRPFSRRFLLRAGLVALAVGFVAFSVQWGEGMPRALYVGLAAGASALVVILALRFLMARVSSAS